MQWVVDNFNRTSALILDEAQNEQPKSTPADDPFNLQNTTEVPKLADVLPLDLVPTLKMNWRSINKWAQSLDRRINFEQPSI